MSAEQMARVEEICNDLIRRGVPMTPHWCSPDSPEMEQVSGLSSHTYFAFLLVLSSPPLLTDIFQWEPPIKDTLKEDKTSQQRATFDMKLTKTSLRGWIPSVSIIWRFLCK